MYSRVGESDERESIHDCLYFVWFFWVSRQMIKYTRRLKGTGLPSRVARVAPLGRDRSIDMNLALHQKPCQLPASKVPRPTDLR